MAASPIACFNPYLAAIQFLGCIPESTWLFQYQVMVIQSWLGCWSWVAKKDPHNINDIGFALRCFFFMGFSLSKPPVTKNHAENSTTRSVSPRQKTESPRCAPGLGAKQPGLSPFRRVHSSAGRHQQDALRRSAGSARGCSWPETGTTVAVGKSFYAKKCRRNRVKRRKFVSPTEYGLLVTWRLFFFWDKWWNYCRWWQFWWEGAWFWWKF